MSIALDRTLDLLDLLVEAHAIARADHHHKLERLIRAAMAEAFDRAITLEMEAQGLHSCILLDSTSTPELG